MRKHTMNGQGSMHGTISAMATSDPGGCSGGTIDSTSVGTGDNYSNGLNIGATAAG